MGVWGRMRNRATRLGRLGPSAHGASVTVVVVPAERLKRVYARLRRAMARRAGTHTPQPLVSSVAMGPGSALALLAWPGRQKTCGVRISGSAQFLPSRSQPNFSRALRATSGLGVFDGGNCSRQCHGLQAL